MRTQLATFAAFSFIASSALAERPETIDTTRTSEIVLAYKLDRGASEAHVIEASLTAEALDTASRDPAWALTITLPLSYEVQSVDPSGNALVATSLRTPTIAHSVNGAAVSTAQLLENFRTARIATSIAPSGTVLERSSGLTNRTTTDDALVWLSDILAFHRPQFPEESIAIGDSWLQAINHSDDDLVTSITIRYTLTGYAPHPAGEVAVIDASYSTVIEGQATVSGAAMQRIVGRGNGTGYILFDHQNGRVLEYGIQNGVVVTSSTHSGHRAMMAFNERASARAQVVLPTLTP